MIVVDDEEISKSNIYTGWFFYLIALIISKYINIFQLTFFIY